MSGTKLAGSVAVVTGASSGIGAATAVAFAERGARVVAVARRADRLDEIVARCSTAGSEAMAIPADVAAPGAAEHIASEAAARFEAVDVVVNNAGVSLHQPAQDTSVAEVRQLFETNFFAAVSLTTALLPGMLSRRRGSIVNVTSVAGYLPNPREAVYGATKAALSLWTHALAVDLHGTGVHAGVVSPGPIDTEIWDNPATGGRYRGKLYPPSVVADAVVDVVESGRVHRSAPRVFGTFGPLYAAAGAAMRWGLVRYGAAGD